MYITVKIQTEKLNWCLCFCALQMFLHLHFILYVSVCLCVCFCVRACSYRCAKLPAPNSTHEAHTEHKWNHIYRWTPGAVSLISRPDRALVYTCPSTGSHSQYTGKLVVRWFNRFNRLNKLFCAPVILIFKTVDFLQQFRNRFASIHGR